ncbi:MAG: hypothetical protein JXJ04_17325 [Spirochaetales bacterium]|nr:hypothetical protein [Spirochaetales bacterium]
MAKAKKITVDKINSLFLLRITLAIFFIILGICGMSKTIDESVFSLGQGKILPLEIAFGLIEIISGIVLFLGIFIPTAKKYTSLSTLVILIIWIVRIIITRFVYGLGWINGSFTGFMVWLLILSVELFIAAAIFVIYKRYD